MLTSFHDLGYDLQDNIFYKIERFGFLQKVRMHPYPTYGKKAHPPFVEIFDFIIPFFFYFVNKITGFCIRLFKIFSENFVWMPNGIPENSKEKCNQKFCFERELRSQNTPFTYP